MKKIFSLLLAVILTCSLITPSFATQPNDYSNSSEPIYITIDSERMKAATSDEEIVLFDGVISKDTAQSQTRVVVTTYVNLTVAYKSGKITLTTKAYADVPTAVSFYNLWGSDVVMDHQTGWNTYGSYDEAQPLGMTITAKDVFDFDYGPGQYTCKTTGQHSSNLGTSSFSRTVVATVK